MSAHTTLPWTRDALNIYGNVVHPPNKRNEKRTNVDAAGRSCVCCLTGITILSSEEVDANGELILKAVNNHQSLLAALQVCKDDITATLNTQGLCWNDWTPSYKIDALLGDRQTETPP